MRSRVVVDVVVVVRSVRVRTVLGITGSVRSVTVTARGRAVAIDRRRSTRANGAHDGRDGSGSGVAAGKEAHAAHTSQHGAGLRKLGRRANVVAAVAALLVGRVVSLGAGSARDVSRGSKRSVRRAVAVHVDWVRVELVVTARRLVVV